MRVGILRTPFDINETYERKISLLGENTGNMVFGYALDRLLGTKPISYSDVNENFQSEKYDALVITDLIWIRENSDFEYLNKILDRIKKPIIPISVGLQASSVKSDFKINNMTLNVLKRIEERAVIGVRGDYTASILEKNGIKKYSVIGCPSMYYWNNPDLRVVGNVDKPQKVLSNFRTIYGQLSQKEKHFLAYCANMRAKFVEQTKHILEPGNVNDDKYFSYVSQWINNNKAIYFSVDQWLDDTCGYDFSIGARFHGNVISLWNNVKSLFLYVDSRTKELTDHFDLPAMDIREFQKDKPIKYYYEKADYSLFNKNYAKRYEEFKDFLHVNGLEVSEEVTVKQFASNSLEKKIYVDTRKNALNKEITYQNIINKFEDCKNYWKCESLAEVILELLMNLGEVPTVVKERLYLEKDSEILKKWLKLLISISSIDEFMKKM